MKFALVNRHKAEPQPGLQGVCAHCQSDTISKCGQVKIWHWAHKSKCSCDPWWENETEWHRTWKNNFPIEWQENSHIDSATGERHIADIKTVGGLVIEFQHSAIHPAEIKCREAFYKNMVWVIDGKRLKRDYPRFCKGITDFKDTIVEDYFRSFFPEECLPGSWLDSSRPVYFDFQGIAPIDESDDIRASLWCLLPGRAGQCAIVARISRKQFIEFSSNHPELLPSRDGFSTQEMYIQSKLAAAVETKKRIDLQIAEDRKIKDLHAAAYQESIQRLRSSMRRGSRL